MTGGVIPKCLIQLFQLNKLIFIQIKNPRSIIVDQKIKNLIIFVLKDLTIKESTCYKKRYNYSIEPYFST